MFENVNAALTPKLQASHSVPHLSWPAAPSALRYLGKTVGTKVNDLLRRKEAWGPVGLGSMEVNRTAGFQLARGADMEDEDRSSPPEAFPRLDPPPPITRKRTPRALTTPQDMLISSQPVLNSLDGGAEPPNSSSTSQTDPADPTPVLGIPTEGDHRDMGMANGEVTLSVPDLIHQDSQEAPKGRRSSDAGLKLSLNPTSPIPWLENSSPPAQPLTPSLEPEGPHPDLLSFE